MCQSTLYRVRKKALMEIHGGHDVSYSYLPSYCKVITNLKPHSVANCASSPQDHGIDNALIALWPKVGRRYCCKHLSKNWKREYPGPLMLSLFWMACRAYSPFTFRKAIEALQKTNPLALTWLAKLGPQYTWSKHAFDPNVKSDVTKTNFVESFNGTLGIDRCRPILTLLEGIRRVTMVRMATRRQMCEEWDRDD
ncbi:putative membrane protein insertion efficiency factor [Bienertia sinuspersici]